MLVSGMESFNLYVYPGCDGSVYASLDGAAPIRLMRSERKLLELIARMALVPHEMNKHRITRPRKSEHDGHDEQLTRIP